MSYTPPSGSAVAFVQEGGYAAPSGGAVPFSWMYNASRPFGVLTGSAVSLNGAGVSPSAFGFTSWSAFKPETSYRAFSIASGSAPSFVTDQRHFVIASASTTGFVNGSYSPSAFAQGEGSSISLSAYGIGAADYALDNFSTFAFRSARFVSARYIVREGSAFAPAAVFNKNTSFSAYSKSTFKPKGVFQGISSATVVQGSACSFKSASRFASQVSALVGSLCSFTGSGTALSVIAEPSASAVDFKTKTYNGGNLNDLVGSTTAFQGDFTIGVIEPAPPSWLDQVFVVTRTNSLYFRGPA